MTVRSPLENRPSDQAAEKYANCAIDGGISIVSSHLVLELCRGTSTAVASDHGNVGDEASQEVEKGESRMGGSRVYACSYCKRKLSTSQAVGGHQNAHMQEHALVKQRKGTDLVPGLFGGLRQPHLLYYYVKNAGFPSSLLSELHHPGFSDRNHRILHPDFQAYNDAFVLARAPAPPSAPMVGFLGDLCPSLFQKRNWIKETMVNGRRNSLQVCRNSSGLDLTLRL